MGIVGRFIDACNEVQGDRVIQAQDWVDGNLYFVDENECKCLVGHAEDWCRNESDLGAPRDNTISREYDDRGHAASLPRATITDGFRRWRLSLRWAISASRFSRL